MLSYAHVVREDPTRPGLLYAGTENSIYVSFDDGGRWVRLQSNLPHAPVHDLVIQPHFNDLVVATYGRGFWIMDDITPIQQMTDDILTSDVHLFQPRDAYRFRNVESSVSQPGDPAAGRNPEYGSSIHYYLREETSARVTLDILDADGSIVRNLDGSQDEGLHRTYWDLRYAPSETPKMRTKVVEHSHVPIGDDGWRSAGETGRVRPLAPPGQYTVRLRIDDQTYTQPLTVLKDPNSEASLADIRENTSVVLELRDDANATVDLIDEIESIRSQVYALNERIQTMEGTGPILEAGDSLDAKLVDLEMLLTDPRMSGGMAGQDRLRWPRQLYAKLTSLAGYVGSSDFAPTVQQVEARDRLQGLLGDYLARMQDLRDNDLAELNRLLNQAGVPVIMGRPAPRGAS
jgi:hypothetical protein